MGPLHWLLPLPHLLPLLSRRRHRLPSRLSRASLAFRILLDSSTPLVFWKMPTRTNSSASDLPKSSTDVFPCLPSSETLSPVLDFIFREQSIRPEPALTPSPMDGRPSRPCPRVDFFRSLFSVDSLSLVS